MKRYARAWPARFEHVVDDPASGMSVTVPKQQAQRSTLSVAIDGERARIHLATERAHSASEIVLHFARFYESAPLPPAQLAALEAQLVRGLEVAGYRHRRDDAALVPSIMPPRTGGGRVVVAWSPLRPNQDVIQLLVESLLPVDATALVLGQPYGEESLHDVEWEEGMPTWSLEGALALLAIAGHPTLRTIEIEARCASEGVAIGDPALLFATLPRLLTITNGPTTVRR